MKRYEVIFTPDAGGAWNATIPAVPGCHTWGRSLAAARRYIREALEVSREDGDRERLARDAELVERIKLPGEAGKALARYQRSSERREKAERVAQADVEAAVRLLTVATRLSLRDAGELLGLSHERVNQIAKNTVPSVRFDPRKAMSLFGGKRVGHRRAG